MKPLTLLPLLGLLAACAPTTQAQPTYTFEGNTRFVFLVQKIRVTYTVNPVTHEARGEYRNLSSGDTPRLNASLLGLGIGNVPLKASGTLAATITAGTLTGTLRVNGFNYPITLTRAP